MPEPKLNRLLGNKAGVSHSIGTVGGLKELLDRLPDDALIGQSRVIEQDGEKYEVFDTVQIYWSWAATAEGRRGQLLDGRPEYCPPEELDLAQAREVFVIGRSRLP